MLIPFWRTLPTTPARPHIRPGTPEYAEAVRAEIRAYVKLIWAEAWNAGAVFGIERAPVRLVLDAGPIADAVVARLKACEAVSSGH